MEFLLGDIAIKNHEMLTEELKKLQPRVTAMINDKDYSQSTRIAKELGHVLQGVSGEGKVENELDAIVEDEEARQRDTEQERQDEEDEVLAA